MVDLQKVSYRTYAQYTHASDHFTLATLHDSLNTCCGTKQSCVYCTQMQGTMSNVIQRSRDEVTQRRVWQRDTVGT